MDWLTTWLTPIWILGVGALAALVILCLLWGVLALVRPAAAKRVPELVFEGALMPVFWVTALLAAFAIAGYPLASDQIDIL
ncbi:MAG: hypothetical protein AAGF97_14740, partial [Planctomycetota bacterium]